MPVAPEVQASPRTPLRIDVDAGRLETAGHHASFDPAAPDDALIAYLKLVRRLRDVEREPSFVLRRDEVVVLATALRQDAVVVLDRLGELMGATALQRRSMVTAFLAGALLIAVASGAAALVPGARTADRSDVTRVVTADADEPSAGAPAEDRTDDEVGPAADAREAVPATDPVAEPADTSSAPATTPAARTGGGTDRQPPPGPAEDVTRPTPPADDVPAPPASGPDTGDRDAGDVPRDPDDAVVRGPDVRLGERWDLGPEVNQPGADIDIPPDDGPEVVQPGATIDIPAEAPPRTNPRG